MALSLTVTLNAVAVIVLVPTLFVVIPVYGAIGAAWIWVTLNLGYLVFYIYFMHRRLLPTDKWRWYRHDVLPPALSGTLAAAACRFVLARSPSRVVEIGELMVAFLVVSLAGAEACQSTRDQMRKFTFAALRRTGFA